jgi:DNA-binding SARP family transcriptional activator/tetratricopeptide (TPR) repeat protein
MPTASLRTLGQFELLVEGQSVPSPGTKKARAILAYLIGRAGSDVSRERLLEVFWPGSGPQQASQSLKTALSSIRRCLREAGLGADSVLVAEKSVVRWIPRSTLDSERFVSLSAQEDDRALQEALLLHRGDFLEGDFDDWAVAERERIDSAYENLLDRIVRSSGSAEAAQRLLARNPYNESAYEAMIDAELRAGRPLAASAIVERCRAALKEVGTEPSASFEEKYGALQRPAQPPAELRVPRFPLADAPSSGDGAPAAATREATVRCPVFIGRRSEIEKLSALWKSAAKAQGAIALIEGEAGIGKTRLVQELIDIAAARGGSVVVAHCLDYAPSPLGPLLDVVRSLHARNPAVIERSGPLRSALASLIPELTAPAPAERDPDKRVQLDAILNALRLHAANPLIVVIEDAQWADSATLDGLQHIAGAVHALKLLLVITARTGDQKFAERYAAFARRLTRSFHIARITLAALDETEMGDFVESTLENHPMPPAAMIGQARLMAEGNPLFAEQLLRTAVDGALAGRADVALPTSVSDIALERLAGLDPDQRTVLSVAAASGRSFDVDFLERVSTMQRATVIGALRCAVDLQLLDAVPGQPETFGFHHALFRAAIYGQLLAVEQKELHLRILRVLETGGGSEDHTAELAYHSWRAGPLPIAVEYNERAGDAASLLWAFEDAAQFYERALSATPDHGAARADMLVKLSRMQHFSGAIEAARRSLGRAIDDYEGAGDAVASAKACVALSSTLVEGGKLDDSLAVLQRALTLLEPYPKDPLQFATRSAMANVFVFKNDPVAALETLEQADRLEGEREDRMLIRFFLWRGHARAFTGDLQGADEDHARAVALAEKDRDGLSLVILFGSYGIRAAYMGLKECSLEALRRGLAAAKAYDIRGLVRAFCVLQCASASQQFGDLESARTHLRAYLAIGLDQPRIQVYCALVGVPVALRLLDFDLARRCAPGDLLQHGFDVGLPEFVGSVATGFAELYHDQGRHEEAAALLHRALEALPERSSPLDDEALDYLFVQTALFGYERDAPAARRLLALRTGLEANRGPAACLALFDALVAKRAGDQKSMRAQAKSAAAAFKGLAWPHYEAIALELLGKQTEALELYKAMGNLRDANRLELALFAE